MRTFADADTATNATPKLIAPPSAAAIAAGLCTGSVALQMLGLQPLLLGALADEHRLAEGGIGIAATVELLALGLTTGALAAMARPTRLPLINVAACVALAAANVATMASDGAWLVLSRAAAGTAAGVLVWIAVALITRAARPDRLSGIFLTVQTLGQAALAAVLPLTLMPIYGANGGLGALAGLAVCAMAAALWLPAGLSPLPKSEVAHGRLPLRGMIGLAAVFFMMAGIVGLWVFVEQLGAGTRQAGVAVAAALAAQVAGSSLAAGVSGRLPTLPILIGAGLLDIGIVRILGGAIGGPAYLASVVLFGFLWLFVMPFQVRMLIALDPSRRVAMLLSGTQMVGMAAGPLATSAFATSTSLRGALNADTALFAIATICVTLLIKRK